MILVDLFVEILNSFLLHFTLTKLFHYSFVASSLFFSLLISFYLLECWNKNKTKLITHSGYGITVHIHHVLRLSFGFPHLNAFISAKAFTVITFSRRNVCILPFFMSNSQRNQNFVHPFIQASRNVERKLSLVELWKLRRREIRRENFVLRLRLQILICSPLVPFLCLSFLLCKFVFCCVF